MNNFKYNNKQRKPLPPQRRPEKIESNSNNSIAISNKPYLVTEYQFKLKKDRETQSVLDYEIPISKSVESIRPDLKVIVTADAYYLIGRATDGEKRKIGQMISYLSEDIRKIRKIYTDKKFILENGTLNPNYKKRTSAQIFVKTNEKVLLGFQINNQDNWDDLLNT